MAEAVSQSSRSSASCRRACLFCRKRKLRCNREVPKCDSCLKFGYTCEYGPQREQLKRDTTTGHNPSHVKKFEDRLGRVENLLSLREANGKRKRTDDSSEWDVMTPDSSVIEVDQERVFSRESIRELEEDFFTYVHPSVNIIHQPTYLHLRNLTPDAQPPVFLRHAMCCLSASASRAHSHLKDSLYQSSRKLLQEAEIKDQNYDKVSIAHAQTWIIIAVYELKEGFMHRSLMSISRAVRLVQLLRLHRVDKRERLKDPTLDLIPTPEDWLQAEERRRLFWMVFLMDRYTGISMGWPILIDRRDVCTLLPATEEAFQNATFEPSTFLSEAGNWEKHSGLSSFAAQIVGVDLCCSRIQDLTRLEISSDPGDWTGNTWAKAVKIESLLSGIFPVPPQHTIPPGKLSPGNVFLNMGQSATIIMAHRIAAFQSKNSPLSHEFVMKGASKTMEAANTIVRLMKMTSHWNVHMFHPSTTFCVYIAALVFGKAWDTNPDDSASQESLKFLLASLYNFKSATRLAFMLIEDIEQEIPGMLSRLNGDSTESSELVHEFLNISDDNRSEPVFPRHNIHKQAPEPRRIPRPSLLAAEPVLPSTPPDLSFDATAWIVDDPDIANVTKLL